MKFNGVDMPSWFRINSVYGKGLNSQYLDLTSTAGMDGAHLNSVNVTPRMLDVKVRIDAKDKEELQERIDEVNAVFDVQEPVPIVFPDEPDFTYYGVPELASQDGDRRSFFNRDVITFVCPDPYKYGPEKTVVFPSDLVAVENTGYTETFPIYEMTVTAPITFAMIQNQLGESLLVGEPADDDIQAVDTRTSVLYENGGTLEQWEHTENRDMISDDSNVDSLDGEMGTDGAGIIIENNATPRDKQRGPAIFRELPEAIQDFEIESTFDIISRRESENFRTMIYFLDENMNNLGQMGIKNNSKIHKRRVPIAQLGQHNQGERLIGDHSPRLQPAPDTTLMYLRAKREGKRFTFYLAHWRDQRHETVWEASFNDINNLYQGRLKYITLFIGTLQDRETPNRNRINSVEVTELATVEEDQTPYIAYPGDRIIFDMKNEEILVNGEDLMTEKAFVSGFFGLKKGENTLGVLPEDSLGVEMKYRERRR